MKGGLSSPQEAWVLGLFGWVGWDAREGGGRCTQQHRSLIHSLSGFSSPACT